MQSNQMIILKNAPTKLSKIEIFLKMCWQIMFPRVKFFINLSQMSQKPVNVDSIPKTVLKTIKFVLCSKRKFIYLEIKKIVLFF